MDTIIVITDAVRQTIPNNLFNEVTDTVRESAQKVAEYCIANDNNPAHLETRLSNGINVVISCKMSGLDIQIVNYK